jgi:N-acetylmuramoyl-L-alanine amidase
MKIVLSSGHGLYVRGASGYLDEVNEARKVVDRVAQLWRENGVGVDTFHDNTSTSQNQNLSTIVAYHNSRTRDYDVSCHFNAYSTTSKPMGTEVWYYSQQSLASTVSKGMAVAGGFINRGPKQSSSLYFLSNTAMPSILLEVCFVDSSADADLYRRNFEAICKSLAETIGKITIGAPPTEPPVEPPVEPEEPPPDEVTATVDMTITATGPVRITINGQDVSVNAPGAEQPSKPVFQANHQNIICSVFGGNADPNDSAYPPYDKITDSELGCALPWKFAGTRPSVLVHNIATGKDVVCAIRDVGPWVIDDEAYVLGDEVRPVAEPKGSKIPRGKNKGKTSNGAGLDLTPAAAKAIGLSGMGNVHWRFVDENDPSV